SLDGAARFAVTIDALPLERLPGLSLAELPFSGRLSGELELAVDAAAPLAPRVRGALSLREVTLHGQPPGGGSLQITPIARGGIRARGAVIDGVSVDG